MCGIIGQFLQEPDAQFTEGLQCGLRALHHRGPDDHGFIIEETARGRLGLGHTRLSILDLSSAGQQPMHSADGRWSIIFNGEIYNYRELRIELKSLGHIFHTETDTEVLLAAWAEWEEYCLAKLMGMFAFAVFDRRLKTLSCVRDAFGIKPFYYRHSARELHFASEVSALFAIWGGQPQPNWQRAYDYLVWGRYDDQETTFYEEIKHLLPGHWFRFSLERPKVIETKRWWWPSIEERTDLTFNQAAERLREMFLENVRLHLRSDVPVGAALSGGIDSSAIVCAMRHLEPNLPIHTFSYVARDSNANEETWVDLVNNYVNAIPHKVLINPEEFHLDLKKLVQNQCEPFGSTSIYAQYRVFQAARNEGITVMLEGQGADELLAGYNGYPIEETQTMLDQRDWAGLLRYLLDESNNSILSRSDRVKAILSHVIPKHLYHLAYRGIGKISYKGIKTSMVQQNGISTTHHDVVKHSDAMGRRIVNTLRHQLTGGGIRSSLGITALLRHGDRNSMHHSIESRVPFLTTNLAEFQLTLPESFLTYRGETKRLFREAMKGIVPNEILSRRDKIGFVTPERLWLSQQENFPNWPSNSDRIPFLDYADCLSEVNKILLGKRKFNTRAWRIMNYFYWANELEKR